VGVKRCFSKLWRWEPFRRAAAVYLVMRIGLSLWAVVVLAVAPVEGGTSLAQPYGEDGASGGGWTALLLGPWWRFDTVHYTELAVHWYQPGSLRTVFPPLYPFLIRVIGGVLGRRSSFPTSARWGIWRCFLRWRRKPSGRRPQKRPWLMPCSIHGPLYFWLDIPSRSLFS
jgi:hypothetical protein